MASRESLCSLRDGACVHARIPPRQNMLLDLLNLEVYPALRPGTPRREGGWVFVCSLDDVAAAAGSLHGGH